MARKNKASEAVTVSEIVEDEPEMVLVEANDDEPVDEFGMFVNGGDIPADFEPVVNPLGVRAPRSKTSVDLESMTVTVDGETFYANSLSPETRDRLLLEGLKSVLLREGQEVYSKLEDGTYKTKEPIAPKPTIRAAAAAALVERGMDPDVAARQVAHFDRATLGQLKRDPDVARHLAALRGETSVLDGLIS